MADRAILAAIAPRAFPFSSNRHAERSEASHYVNAETLRYAQGESEERGSSNLSRENGKALLSPQGFSILKVGHSEAVGVSNRGE